MGLSREGGTVLQRYTAWQLVGLKLAGSAVASGAAGLTTSAKVISFDSSLWPEGFTAYDVQIKAVGQVLTLTRGEGGSITVAADTFSPKLPIDDLIDSNGWTAHAAATANIEYIIWGTRKGDRVNGV